MSEQTRQFTYKNETFVCAHCGTNVEPSSTSCRNHCPHCLYSMHVDVFPGDRQANCGGLMVPLTVEFHSKKGYQIIHQCTVCSEQSRNILHLDDKIQPDSLDAVLALMQQRS